jgi:mercuric ion transport protein
MPESGNGRGALFAGGLAAILASACCLGPLVLLTLGINGAWIGNLTALEPYRPVFIGAALVALFFAWRRIYRPQQACKPDEVCAIPQVRVGYKVIFWTVAALVLAALAFPYVLPCFIDQELTVKNLLLSLALVGLATPVWADIQTVTLSVPGMTCAACPITVRKALSMVEGVRDIDVNYENREAVVSFDDEKASVEDLTRATENAGYPSSVKR